MEPNLPFCVDNLVWIIQISRKQILNKHWKILPFKLNQVTPVTPEAHAIYIVFSNLQGLSDHPMFAVKVIRSIMLLQISIIWEST